MARRYIDCRDYPQGAKRCTVAISADTVDELIPVVVQHAVTMHGYEDTPEFRGQVREGIRTGSPPV
jgi:predicted small metal-binding protein